jgi:hypothetical protein
MMMMVVTLAAMFFVRVSILATFAVFFDDLGYPAKRFGCLTNCLA